MTAILKFPIPAPQLKTADKHSKYIDVLSKLASNLEPTGNAKIAACVVYQNTIVAFGNNKNKTHPFQAKYGRNSESICLHAETDVIKNSLKLISQEQLSRSALYICRVKFLDENKKKLIFGLARPCEGCFKAINAFNIKKVFYSLNNEGYSFL